MDNVSSALPVGKISAMRLLKVLLLLGLATLALGLAGTKPASAQEVTSGWISAGVVKTTCSYTDASKTQRNIGAKITMSEGDNSEVEQFRVKFMLYELNPAKRSVDAPEATKSYASAIFGNNTSVNETWSASHTFKMPAKGQYVLRAKYTFVNATGWPDTIWTVDARVCNNTKGGYVQNKYYAPPK